MRWFERGDLDGFFGLALDNLVQLLLIIALCGGLLGFPDELLYGRVLPAVAVSLLVGNLFYAWQAKRLAARTGRNDVCALPYGVNTVSLFAFVLLVMAPAKFAAEASGQSPTEAAYTAWRVGIVACFGSGLIEFFGSFVATPLRRFTPRAALLSTLSGIALGFIAMPFLFRTFERPVVGFTTLGVILITYFGAVRFRGGIPGGLVAVGLGTALAWLTGIAPTAGLDVRDPAVYLPVPVFAELWSAASDPANWSAFAVILPMGLFSLISSLQNLESAEAAGDRYPEKSSLAVNGLGTLAAAGFGSCFPTTIYIGHPGWKALGARAGYSVLNAVFFSVVCVFGVVSAIAWAVPIDAGMAIVLYIGIVITAQAFQATPQSHAPAVVPGLLPGVAAWGVLMAKTSLKVVGYGGAEKSFAEVQQLEPTFRGCDLWLRGGFALAEGFLLTSMILAAATVAIIERRFREGSAWAVGGAGLSALGLMHSYEYAPADTTTALLTPAWQWALGYAVFAALLFVAPWVTEKPQEG